MFLQKQFKISKKKGKDRVKIEARLSYLPNYIEICLFIYCLFLEKTIFMDLLEFK